MMFHEASLATAHDDAFLQARQTDVHVYDLAEYGIPGSKTLNP